MCGIAGIWQRDGRPVEPASLAAMLRSLAYRGPDGEGRYIGSEGIALGHRRLKVIDLSRGASQPIWLPDRSICMVFNGEIHNYRELARELEREGARLRSQGDTEVLLWAYRVWGEACFDRLNGMWAAAFWEPAKRRLLLSRDRFGIKPLVFSERGHRVAFASEPKAILAAFAEECRPDWQRARRFIEGKIPDPDGGANTFFQNIRALEPGQTLSFEPTRAIARSYWSFTPGSEVARPDAADAFLELLRDAVRLRLRSDVPLGATLSGGLDSSTIAALASQTTENALPCFSLRYSEAKIDESHFAAMVADNTRQLRLHWVRPSSANIMETMAGIVWHHDAPTLIRGRFPQWHLNRYASQFVTVLLGGQGADELLAGYDRFAFPYLLDRMNWRLPRPRGEMTLPRELFHLGQVSARSHRIFSQRVAGSLLRRFGLTGRPADRGPERSGESTDAVRPFASRLNNALWRELRYCGLPELLHAEDACSMAFSLESRLPFLDHRVVEFCFSLPFYEKIKHGWTKSLLRDASRGLLPEAVRLRRRKLGLAGDYAGWLGSGNGLTAIRELLLTRESLGRGASDPRWLRRIFGGSSARASRWIRQHQNSTWRVATFEIWCRQFLDRDTSMLPATIEAAHRRFRHGALRESAAPISVIS